MLNTYRQSLFDLSSEIRFEAMIVHDWLAHIADDACVLNDYGLSLHAIVMIQLQNQSGSLSAHYEKIVNNDLSSYTLLYRHYLAKYSLEQEIFLTKNSSILYSIIAISMTKDHVFCLMDDPSLWDGIDLTHHPINGLRRNRPIVKRYVDDLSMQDDVSPNALLNSHGYLSSPLLLYGLYLCYVLFTYEATIQPDSNLDRVLTVISTTLTQLKGVFNNAENQWF